MRSELNPSEQWPSCFRRQSSFARTKDRLFLRELPRYEPKNTDLLLAGGYHKSLLPLPNDRKQTLRWNSHWLINAAELHLTSLLKLKVLASLIVTFFVRYP